MDKNKFKFQASSAALVLLIATMAVRAAPITFSESGMSGAAPSAAFNMAGGQLHITLSSSTEVVVPSTSLTGVSWTMGATPVLAVSQVPAASSSLPAANGQTTAQFGFKTGVNVDPNLYKSFGSYKAQGITGVAMAATEKGVAAMSLSALTASAQVHPIMLTLPSSYVVVNTAQQTFQVGSPVPGSIATVIRAVGTPTIAVGVPLPSAMWTGFTTMAGLAALGLYRRRRSA